MPVLDLYPRALARLAPDMETYLQRHWGKKQRQTYQRKFRRLAEQGELTVSVLNKDEDLEQWLDEFLALESSGWKGAEGSALSCNQPDACFFREFSREAFARGRLLMVAMRMNGKAIAALHNVYAGYGAFQIKTAYDESWQQYSPGKLTYMETLRILHEQKRCEWIDSCVSVTNTSAREVWRQQRLIGDLVIPVGRRGLALLHVVQMGREIRRLIKSAIHH